jgi:hypothetical protein
MRWAPTASAFRSGTWAERRAVVSVPHPTVRRPATMTSVPQVPVACASALVRAKHRGHVACPQASLQLGQPLLGQGETAAQFCRSLHRSREWVDTGRLGAVNVGAIFLSPRRADQRLHERISSCRAPSEESYPCSVLTRPFVPCRASPGYKSNLPPLWRARAGRAGQFGSGSILTRWQMHPGVACGGPINPIGARPLRCFAGSSWRLG